VLPPAGPVRFTVQVQAPPEARIALLRDGSRVMASHGSSLQYTADPSPAVYRAEVSLDTAAGDASIPWIVSNPIYVGRATEQPPAPEASPRPAAAARSDLYTDGPAPGWSVEHSSESQGAVDVVKAVTGTQLVFRYALSGAGSSHPFAALVVPAGAAVADHDRITFRARADRPTRLSVQLRAPTPAPDGERWHRSVFLDTTPREISVRFDDMRPRGATTSVKPVLKNVHSVLFVVDTVNTPIGTAGQLSFDDVRYER
jgi:hypothetical protein